MDYPIFESSPKVQALIVGERKQDGYPNKHHLNKYPFEELNVGQSFQAPLTASEASLRQSSVIRGKILNRKFTVKKHPDCYEVGRIA